MMCDEIVMRCNSETITRGMRHYTFGHCFRKNDCGCADCLVDFIVDELVYLPLQPREGVDRIEAYLDRLRRRLGLEEE